MKMVCWTCNRQEKSPSRLLGGDFLLSKKKDEDGLVQGGYKSDQAEDNARDIGNKDRPVLVLLQKGVAAPKGAVEGYIVMTFSDKPNSRYQRYRVLQEAFSDFIRCHIPTD